MICHRGINFHAEVNSSTAFIMVTESLHPPRSSIHWQMSPQSVCVCVLRGWGCVCVDDYQKGLVCDITSLSLTFPPPPLHSLISFFHCCLMTCPVVRFHTDSLKAELLDVIIWSHFKPDLLLNWSTCSSHVLPELQLNSHWMKIKVLLIGKKTEFFINICTENEENINLLEFIRLFLTGILFLFFGRYE